MNKEGVLNLFTILAILAALMICVFLGYLFINPTSVLNPLSPEELPELIVIPTATWSPPELPEIITEQVNSVEVQSTATERVLLPSSTPLPTRTSFILPTATNTFTPTATLTETPTITPTNSAYQCKVMSAFPESGKEFTTGVDFDGRWTLKNTGTQVWEESVDWVYVSGFKFQAIKDKVAFDLGKTVNTDESVEIIIDMLAPKDAGTYESIWSLKKNDLYFCQVTLKITVK
jgi:hypothetical protein